MQFIVEDTGCGIPAESLGAIFKDFQQVEGPNSLHTQGTGLGLAITRRIVGLMEGEISVESYLGEGTKFTLDVPVGAASSQSRKSGKINRDFTGGKALIVDDLEVNVRILERRLSQLGMVCTVAMSAEEARTILQERDFEFDVILLDQKMPGETGEEFARKLRSGERGQDIPLIMPVSYTHLTLPTIA